MSILYTKTRANNELPHDMYALQQPLITIDSQPRRLYNKRISVTLIIKDDNSYFSYFLSLSCFGKIEGIRPEIDSICLVQYRPFI